VLWVVALDHLAQAVAGLEDPVALGPAEARPEIRTALSGADLPGRLQRLGQLRGRRAV
jgi:hypothetical protein